MSLGLVSVAVPFCRNDMTICIYIYRYVYVCMLVAASIHHSSDVCYTLFVYTCLYLHAKCICRCIYIYTYAYVYVYVQGHMRGSEADVEEHRGAWMDEGSRTKQV